MKKKILLFAILALTFACVFALTAFAENKIIKLSQCPTLEEIHANPEAYVSHLDAFDGDSFGEIDSYSVAVLCDSNDPKVAPTYYYVFPSYYYARNTNNTVYGRLTMLNEAIAAADPTAFANYNATDGNWGSGSCKYLVRYEVPTYVTSITKTTKFEYATNLMEIYFPTKTVVDAETGEEKIVTCVTSIEGQNTFTGCANLETVGNFDKLPITIYNNGAFSGCAKLTGITIHDGITSIPGGMFSGCKKLNNVTIPYGVTSIGDSAFYDCDTITEMFLPNTVISISKKSFASMDNLEVISFGAGLTHLYSGDHNLEVLTGCNKLKYVYMPASFATTVQNTGYSIMSTASPTATIFFTGTKSEAEAIRDKLPQSGNDLMYKSEYVEYDPDIDYTTYAETLGYRILVYNYSSCIAFNNGVHDVAGEYSLEYSGEEFLSSATKSKACANCIYKVDKSELGALFVCLGYSTNGRGSVIQGFSINSAVRADYESVLGEFTFGVIAAGDSREDKTAGADVFSFEKNIYHDLSKSSLNYFEIKVSGIEDDLCDAYVFFCAYVTVGDINYYINNGVVDTVATSTTYNIATA